MNLLLFIIIIILLIGISYVVSRVADNLSIWGCIVIYALLIAFMAFIVLLSIEVMWGPIISIRG